MTFQDVDPAQYIRQVIEENKSPGIKGLPSFTGGLVGYFSYDFIKYAEPGLIPDAEDQEGFQDVDLMLFDKVIAFDNLKQKIICMVNIRLDAPEENYKKACLELEDGILYTFPLAGTRPRGKNAKEDAALEAELLADPKELAEHNMLVDLGRNDLGKISRFGSVEVEKYMSIERYSHVMHIGSTVRGEIQEKRDAVDAIKAVLPAGTLSGAPKIRACEIINELENNKRGIYGGAIGYIDFAGNMDTCIAIRIAFQKNGKVFIRSGAGIVADSVPQKEYQECINKARAVVEALQTAEGGIDV